MAPPREQQMSDAARSPGQRLFQDLLAIPVCVSGPIATSCLVSRQHLSKTFAMPKAAVHPSKMPRARHLHLIAWSEMESAIIRPT